MKAKHLTNIFKILAALTIMAAIVTMIIFNGRMLNLEEAKSLGICVTAIIGIFLPIDISLIRRSKK